MDAYVQVGVGSPTYAFDHELDLVQEQHERNEATIAGLKAQLADKDKVVLAYEQGKAKLQAFQKECLSARAKVDTVEAQIRTTLSKTGIQKQQHISFMNELELRHDDKMKELETIRRDSKALNAQVDRLQVQLVAASDQHDRLKKSNAKAGIQQLRVVVERAVAELRRDAPGERNLREVIERARRDRATGRVKDHTERVQEAYEGRAAAEAKIRSAMGSLEQAYRRALAAGAAE